MAFTTQVAPDSALKPASSGKPGGAARLAPALAHACLQLFEPSKDGALDKPGDPLGEIEFQFNPKELTITKSASWARKPAKENKTSGPPQYMGPLPSKLTIEMFFDSSAKRDKDVTDRVNKLLACCRPTPNSLARKKGSPPWVLFRWGTLTEAHFYVSSVQVKYTLFTPEGLPIRATCTVTLEEIAGEPPKPNPTSGGLMPRRRHVVVDGDTLAGLAYREYGNPSLWRAVAALNKIDDPMRLRSGTSVLLPSIDELVKPDDRAVAAATAERGDTHAPR